MTIYFVHKKICQEPGVLNMWDMLSVHICTLYNGHTYTLWNICTHIMNPGTTVKTPWALGTSQWWSTYYAQDPEFNPQPYRKKESRKREIGTILCLGEETKNWRLHTFLRTQHDLSLLRSLETLNLHSSTDTAGCKSLFGTLAKCLQSI